MADVVEQPDLFELLAVLVGGPDQADGNAEAESEGDFIDDVVVRLGDVCEQRVRGTTQPCTDLSIGWPEVSFLFQGEKSCSGVRAAFRRRR